MQKSFINGSINIVISNNPNAFGIERAKNHSINYKTNDRNLKLESILTELWEELKINDPQFIVLALAPIMTESFKISYKCSPFALPKYPGLDTHKKVLNNGDLKHGVTIHYVNDVLDGGEIIAQGEIKVNPNETFENLKTRIHAIEHVMLPMVVSKFADGSLNKNDIIYEKF